MSSNLYGQSSIGDTLKQGGNVVKNLAGWYLGLGSHYQASSLNYQKHKKIALVTGIASLVMGIVIPGSQVPVSTIATLACGYNASRAYQDHAAGK